MIDEARAQEWERDACSVVARHYGTGEAALHIAPVEIAPLGDNEDLLRYSEFVAQHGTRESA